MPNTVSVIVPIYKVEDYLCRCVDSILAQTYPHLEIILVDDGSPDECGMICDGYMHRDPRIRVIHKQNGGLSDARNAGLDIATGEAIFFLDSDDWISPDAIATLIAYMDDSVDLVAGAAISVYEDHPHTEDLTPVTSGAPRRLDREAAMKDFLLGGWAAWNKLYRTELFQTIRFPVGKINEDEAIMLHILELCDDVLLTDHPTYFYFQRPNSITTSSFSEKKMDWFYNCTDNLRFIEENHPDLRPAALHRLASSIILLLQNMLLQPSRFAPQISELKLCLKMRYKDFINCPYTISAEKKWLRILAVTSALHLDWLFRLSFSLLHPNIDRG